MAYVIGDIAGEFKALKALIEQFPKNEEIILVGDMIDRGKQSNRVIEWAMNADNVRALKGNHEHMMLDFHGRAYENQRMPIYDRGIWGYNGGDMTLESYGVKGVLKEHLDWLEALPLYIDEDGFFISHSSWYKPYSLEKVCDINDRMFIDFNIIWNREEPVPIENKLQIFGHNSQWGLREFKDDGGKIFAICLDDSRRKKLTAYDTKTGKIYQQKYIK